MLSLPLSTPPRPPSTGRLVELDEAKGCAMLLVLLYHAGGVLGWRNWLHGEVGVDVFLIVSGFLLAATSPRLPAGEFVRRRILRIFPAYWIAFALFAALDAKFYPPAPTVPSVLLHATGLHAFGPPEYFSEINDSFWFISLILLLYGVFLALRRHLADLSLVIGTGALLTTAVTAVYLFAGHDGGLVHLCGRIPSFFIGLVAAQLLFHGGGTLRLNLILALGLLSVIYLGWLKNRLPVYAFAGTGMLAGLLAGAHYLRRLVIGRALLAGIAFVGVHSYEIYLLHQPLFREYNFIAWNRLTGRNPTIPQAAIGIAVALLLIIPAAVLLHRLVDRLLNPGRAVHSAPNRDG